MNLATATPKVFISYSWTSTDRVIELAQRLKHDGIDVVLDKWKLNEGQDKYAFMEQCVTDESINKVLMICDKTYAEKANERKGGVGDETMIISTEVYGKAKQEKFIPIIFERDENGNEYSPAYLKSRIYIDLTESEQYEKNYENLLRNLYNKPEYSEPPLGKMPEWLNEENVSLSEIRTAVKQIQTYDGRNPSKLKYIIQKFNDDFVNILLEFTPKRGENYDDRLLQQIDASKPLRDLFLDYVEALIINGGDIGTIIGDFFEHIFNGTYIIEGSNSYRDSDFDFTFFLIWEMYICSTAVLLHYKNYQDLHNMLNRTYFLRENPINPNKQPFSFTKFRLLLNCYIEENIKPNSKTPDLFTLAGDIIVKRAKKPIITQSTMANADLILYQLSCIYDFAEDLYHQKWFPALYPYWGIGKQEIWGRMVSQKHCQKLFPLFGVTQTRNLIEQIKKSENDRDMRYSGSYSVAYPIIHSIELDKIGSMP